MLLSRVRITKNLGLSSNEGRLSASPEGSSPVLAELSPIPSILLDQLGISEDSRSHFPEFFVLSFDPSRAAPKNQYLDKKLDYI